MPNNTDKLDQSYAHTQVMVDNLVQVVRESQDRKRERHGDKYDPAKALLDLFPRVHRLTEYTKTILLATTLYRLAEADSPDPFTEIADLDFDFNFDPNTEENPS